MAGVSEPAAQADGRSDRVELDAGALVVDARLLGELLGLRPADVAGLLKTQAITSLCERGVDEHEGEYRLTFFHGNRRARLTVDLQGKVLRRSTIDFGDKTLPRQLHRAGG
ncbi:DUF6522 family protein [Mesorhizobium sp. SP-1A]|uniref:DUF6522 family protein n=1 Tax=Mesorhizobium sp. SP-1A TaxID=3077840 RepID=UPI0028F6C15A|nr:DUF6522 family protein [Mesorhizobium sp. SP-1A]